jgi:hypothetical protein
MMITKRYDAETGIGKRWGVEKRNLAHSESAHAETGGGKGRELLN